MTLEANRSSYLNKNKKTVEEVISNFNFVALENKMGSCVCLEGKLPNKLLPVLQHSFHAASHFSQLGIQT